MTGRALVAGVAVAAQLAIACTQAPDTMPVPSPVPSPLPSASALIVSAGVARHEALHLQAVFFGEYRTAYIKHFSACSQRGPQCVQDFGLQRCETCNVLALAQPLDIRMTPDHP